MTTVKAGERRTFRSTLQDEDGAGILVRLYSDQQITVLDDGAETESVEDGVPGELMFRVRADDGVEFSAWESELIPHGTNVWVNAEGEYITDPEFEFAKDPS